MLIVILLLALFQTIVGREWHITSLYGDRTSWSSKLFYPKFHQCSNKNDLRLQLDYTLEEVGNWSTILNEELFYLSTVPDSYAEELIVDNINNYQRGIVILQTLILVFVLDFIIALLSLLLMPLVGAIGIFIFGGITFVLIKIVQIIGRKVILIYERIKWRRDRLVLPKSAKKLHVQSRHYKIPYFFRTHSDQQVYKTFEHVSSDESNSTDEEEEQEERLVAELENKVRLKKLSVSLTSLKFHKKLIGLQRNQVQPQVPKAEQILNPITLENQSLLLENDLKIHQMSSQGTMEADSDSDSDHKFLYVVNKHPGRPFLAALGRKKRRKSHKLDPGISDTIQHALLQEQATLSKKIKVKKKSGKNKFKTQKDTKLYAPIVFN